MVFRSFRRRLVSAGVSLAIAAAAASASAAVPPTLTHQGRLFDDMGAPVSATVDVEFRIYDSPNAAEPVWTETHTVSFEDGFFSVALGADAALAPLLGKKELFLGITVGEGAEMSPRTRAWSC